MGTEARRLRVELAKAATRLEILHDRLAGCHEQTGRHELMEEAELFCKEAREALGLDYEEMPAEGDHRVDHRLFEGVLFPTREGAVLAAERLVDLLVRSSDRREARVDVLRWDTDSGGGSPEQQTRWWWATTVSASLEISEES